jgi:hypothetical protein
MHENEMVTVNYSDNEKLRECYLLLTSIARDSRPIVGGYRDMARDLLARHGVFLSREEVCT